MIQLIDEQQRELTQPEPIAIDPRTQEEYVIVPRHVYERLRALLDDTVLATGIANDQELSTTLERIQRFQAQVAHLRKVETNSTNYYLAASGFLAGIDRMQLEVREYLSFHPTELATST